MTRSSEHQTLQAIMTRARELGDEVDVLHDDLGIVEIRRGNRSTRFCYLLSNLNPYVPVRLAQNKRLTNTILARAGLPVPRGVTCRTLATAVGALQSIGAPVVVKPLHGTMGKGVTVGIADEAQLEVAVAEAQKVERPFLVEEQCRGEDYRVLVLDGSVLGVVHRVPPTVTGDGVSPISKLIEEREAARVARIGKWAEDRGLTQDAHLTEVLQSQGLAPESILGAGQVARLRRNANLSTGGTAVALDNPPPILGDLATRAATAIGLRLAGVDILFDRATDGSEHATLLEINETPMLAMHIAPDEGEPRDILPPILEALLGSRPPRPHA